jgi:hypothetical protein
MLTTALIQNSAALWPFGSGPWINYDASPSHVLLPQFEISTMCVFFFFFFFLSAHLLNLPGRCPDILVCLLHTGRARFPSTTVSSCEDLHVEPLTVNS